MATKLYFSSEAPSFTPALEAGYYDTSALRRGKLKLFKDGSGDNRAYTGVATDFWQQEAAWQFVSDPMLAGITFVNNSTIQHGFIGSKCSDSYQGQLQIYVKIYNSGGSKVAMWQGNVGATDGTTAYHTVVNSTYTLYNGSTYTTQAGDILVIEIGTYCFNGGSFIPGTSFQVGFSSSTSQSDASATGQIPTTYSSWWSVELDGLFPSTSTGFFDLF